MHTYQRKVKPWDFLILSTPFISGLRIDASFGLIFLFYFIFVVYLTMLFFRRGKIHIAKGILLLLYLVLLVSILYNIVFDVNYSYSIIYISIVSITTLSYYNYIKECD